MIEDESQSTVAKWQKDHREQLAAKGIELPEEEAATTFHCRRCHRELPIAQYKPHYKTCPGFTSKCYESCPPTGGAGEPVQEEPSQSAWT
jgi:hypothetical protein